MTDPPEQRRPRRPVRSLPAPRDSWRPFGPGAEEWGSARRSAPPPEQRLGPDGQLEHLLELPMHQQPDDTTCGPTCLHAVYRYYGDEIALDEVIAGVSRLENGGTLAVLLGSHALRRGYRATIYTYNLHVFDPTWFSPGAPPLLDRLEQMASLRREPKLRATVRAYAEYVRLGGRIEFRDLTANLLRRYLKRGAPILTGLSSTFLYRASRELPDTNRADDLQGLPVGHFVVLRGYREGSRETLVADPWRPSPMSETGTYWVPLSRLINSILLGIITYDANLLVIEPRARGAKRGTAQARSHPPANDRRR